VALEADSSGTWSPESVGLALTLFSPVVLPMPFLMTHVRTDAPQFKAVRLPLRSLMLPPLSRFP
jgi:hypothetical protein